MLKEFKDFIMRGNVIDLAVAVIIGAAFGKIIDSLVNDIIMPPIGVLLGKVDFSNLFINLSGTPYRVLSEAQAAGAATINYGLFINSTVNFVIIALAIFILLRLVSRLKAAPAEEDPTTRECPYCLSTIPLKATRCASCTSELPPASA